MSQTIQTNNQLTDTEKAAQIKRVIEQAGMDVKARFPILQHQNFIGASLMALSLTGMLVSGLAYFMGWTAWWVCIPLVAIFASVIHELAHDLIHLMYFREKPGVNRFLLLLGWVARPSTINPLVRRKLHFHHHKHSGSESDLEERGITNGERWGLRRLLMTGDNLLSVYLRPLTTHRMLDSYVTSQKPRTASEYATLLREQRLGYFPLAVLHYTAWHGWLLFYAANGVSHLLGHPMVWPSAVLSVMPTLDFLAVAWFAPSALRTFCLHFISSNMHYHGDIESRNVMQQCQVLNVWWLAPLQLFCFNFGSTHAIHHFVVSQPFYIRQLVSGQAHSVMRKLGVRFNDLGTFRRANRWANVEKLPTTL